MKKWEFIPTQGLGNIKFGTSPSEVGLLNDDYGDIVSEHQYGSMAEDLLENLGPFANSFSEEILKMALDDAKDFDQKNASLFEQVRNRFGYLRCDFLEGSLVSITTGEDCSEAGILDLQVFHTAPQKMLSLMAKNFGPVYSSLDTIVFKNAGISLKGFYYQNDQGAWRFFSENDGRSEGRFATIFAPSELDRYLTEEFVEVDFFKK